MKLYQFYLHKYKYVIQILIYIYIYANTLYIYANYNMVQCVYIIYTLQKQPQCMLLLKTWLSMAILSESSEFKLSVICLGPR